MTMQLNEKTVTLTAKEICFLWRAFESLQNDIDYLIVQNAKANTNSSVNKEWFEWLKNNSREIKEKILSDVKIDDLHLLSYFHQEMKEKKLIPAQ